MRTGVAIVPRLLRRAAAQVHLWAGVALCLPLVMLGLTGSVLVFEDELRAAFAPARPLDAGGGAHSGKMHSIGEIVAAARAAAPDGYAVQSYVAPGERGEPAAVRLAPPRRGGERGPGGERVRIDVDPVSLQTFPDSESGFLRQVFFLHSTLLLRNRDGRVLVGWFGVAMLVMAVSGLVNWWPRRGRWRAGFVVSRRARGYRLHRELHAAVGIWGLAVLAVVSFAGVYLAFPETVRRGIDLVLPARDLRAAGNAIKVEPVNGASPLDIDGAVALARERVPDSALRFVFLPTRPDQPIRVALTPSGRDRQAPAIMVFVDPWTRRVAEVLDPRQYSLGESLLAWQHALHAGEGLGPVWKGLVFVSGLLPLLFAVTGVTMWQLRRRRRQPTIRQNSALGAAYTAGEAGE
jgi:uncharacterized iron-regulated membrane protein